MTLGEQQTEVRTGLVQRLRLDLVGPSAPEERLVQDKETREGDTPLTRYLMGILYPSNSTVEPEEDDFSTDVGDDEEDAGPEGAVSVSGGPKPSSIGLSFAVEAGTEEIEVAFEYGLYRPAELPRDGQPKVTSGRAPKPRLAWQRTQVSEKVRIKVSPAAAGRHVMTGGGRGEWGSGASGAEVSMTVFLRNVNRAAEGPDDPALCLFQPCIRVRGVGASDRPFVNRANQGGREEYDPDLRSYRLLYRDKPEFAVGHGCSTACDVAGCPPDRAHGVMSELLPCYELAATEARGGAGLAGLDMAFLAKTADGAAMRRALLPLVEQYEDWIARKREEVRLLPTDLQDVAEGHLGECQAAADRMREGLALLGSDVDVCEAFRFANRAMVVQRRKSVEAANFQKGRGRTFDGGPPSWRPFQVAFILLNLRGIAAADSADRDLVDLLWFPTGGGKTEAYLGLAAFAMALRRMRHARKPGSTASGDGGVTVLMRYTLRLLTVQQFQRAAILICACESLRRKDTGRLGKEPFSIGLWVGGSATPNAIDQKADPAAGREPGAIQVLEAFDPKDEPAVANPVQLRACPWCGEPLSHLDYRARKELLHLQIRCPNKDCEFHGADDDATSGIPAYVVDEDIYLRCPTMIVGTVDKFARLPWDDRTRAFFGLVDRRCVRHGFLAEGADYDRCGGRHQARPGLPATDMPCSTLPFLPPELIIQDELHLINGPLGSLMGLYESAVDLLCGRAGHRPKVVASTATIRRFRDQIRGLFDRDSRQFPAPGLIAGDSFFAAEDKTRPGRLYMGICAPGRSLKTAAVRALACLMHGAEVERMARTAEIVDPYWTTVYYFNSLRELGGALRLIDDDVSQRLAYLAWQEGMPQPRKPERRPELTSRVPARDISQRLREMERTLGSGDALDVLLSTNMISVGVDIQRFGLMLVTGQPKTSAEYIQATSRVGRQAPGLILTLFNWSRPRDLSHYERFRSFHSMMYRHVEASSVTPYSGRARDKGLHAVFIALVRLMSPNLARNDGPQRFDRRSPVVTEVVEHLLGRIGRADPEEVDDARDELLSLIDGWVEQQQRYGTDLKYRPAAMAGPGAPRGCLMQAADEAEGKGFPRGTLTSLRDVERTSGLYFKNFRRPGSSQAGGSS